MEFKCKRCGKCCLTLVDKDFWVKGNLTWQEKQYLLEERKKYDKNDGCSMLYFKDNIAYCLVREIFDASRRDVHCGLYQCYR